MYGEVLSKKIIRTNLIAILAERSGSYTGTGKNQDNKEFSGTLELKTVANEKGISLKFSAIGTEGNEFNKNTNLYSKDTILFSEEWAIICYDSKNELALWSLNSSIGTMAKFHLRRFRQISGTRSLFIFGYGSPESNTIYREEISIELLENGELSYNYSWGESGGHFLSRLTVTMKKTG